MPTTPKSSGGIRPGQLFEYECWYCHQIVGGGNNIAPASPCEHCGIFWGEYGPKVIQVGPPGAHAPEIPTVISLFEQLLDEAREWQE